MELLLAVWLCLIFASVIQASCQGTITISSLADTQALSECRAYNGSITIAPSAEGDIYLEGLESITGDLVVANASALTALYVPNVTTITGLFELAYLPNLTTLDLSQATHIKEIRWNDLPALQGVEFEAGLTKSDSIRISNTGLLNLSGFTLLVAGLLDINNNPSLDTVDLNDIENVTSSIIFTQNAPNLNLQLGSLQFVQGNMTFANISALSTPDLQNVTGSFTCASCAMANYRAQWLMSVGTELAFSDTDLSQLEFPDLVYAASLVLSGNENLRRFSLENFATTEDIFLEGTFDSIEFSNLGHVFGSATVRTSSRNSSICDYFNFAKNDGIIKGDVNCNVNGQRITANTSSTDSPNQPVPEQSSGLSGGAIAGIVVAIILVIATIAAILIFRRRKVKQRAQAVPPQAEIYWTGKATRELPANGTREKAELYADTIRAKELDSRNAPLPELPRTVPGLYEVGSDYTTDQSTNTTGRSEDGIISPVSPAKQKYNMGWDTQSTHSTELRN